MEYKEIKQLMSDMEKADLTSIDITLPDGTRVKIEKENKKDFQQYLDKRTNLEEVKKIEQEKANEKGMGENKKRNIIKSPMVGTFYIKPSPTAEPYVEIGRKVKKGDTLCIIEAMKLMNEIESEYDGKIVEICLNDGETVEYGKPLFVIE